MEQINLTGNVLLRHGFRYNVFNQHGYTLVLPVAREKFLLNWSSMTGLNLCLNLQLYKFREEKLATQFYDLNLHCLDHIQTLPGLKALYEGLTGQPLMELPETDSSYQQEFKNRNLVKLYVKNPGTYSYLTDSMEPTPIYTTDNRLINQTTLLSEGFFRKKGKVVSRMSYNPFLPNNVYLAWAPAQGLHLNLYQTEIRRGAISLNHIRNMGELLGLKNLLRQRLKFPNSFRA